MLGMPDKEYNEMVSKLKAKSKKREENIVDFVIKPIAVLALIVIFAFAIVGWQSITKSRAISNTVTNYTEKPNVTKTLDPRLIKLADDIGINKSNLITANTRVVTQQNCGKLTAAGSCFDGQSILIYESGFSKPLDYQRLILAHEYLHWVWEKNTTNADKQNLIPYINQTYDANSAYFDSRLKMYYDAGMTKHDDQFNSEMHSYIGSEIADWRIPQSLLDHYKQYLPNRNALPSYY